MTQTPSWNPDPDSGVAIHWVEANGQTFEVAQAGDGNKLALCLHGFPELHYSWRFQIPMLVEKGYRVWAPNMRGYGGSSKPATVRDYALDHLCADVAALIDASGAKEFTLIAHDWGAIVAWAFAIQKIRPLKHLVIMNVPHPMVGRREIRHWRQLRRSWYIFFFQLPWLPEFLISRGNGKAIKDAFSNMAHDQSNFPDEALEVFAKAAMRPGSITAMINYYRALLRHRETVDVDNKILDTPTLMIWGEEDSALNIRCTEGTEKWVPNFELHRLPDVSHWVQQEAPRTVNAILQDWLV
ncbi:alpha/beta fold hydrolase [Parasphingorhabdus cellanae]|uniref:Alpha/beta hydrolase n=1 Tax=Parasphingorhabdus cellanae TaxID=2806553 RepID=A0ABX7T565_9SPHN|nr:alpha/beta hydrolase [Parasphingorhabdus cellanae]QTD56686.1 alpha/beta hydrolase [Parasphingorhabdus cellanae]